MGCLRRRVDGVLGEDKFWIPISALLSLSSKDKTSPPETNLIIPPHERGWYQHIMSPELVSLRCNMAMKLHPQLMNKTCSV